MNSLMGAITLIIIATLGIVMGAAYIRRRDGRSGLEWLLVAITLAALACATYLISEETLIADRFGRGFALVVLLAAMFGAFGGFTLSDMEQSRRWTGAWWGLCGAWLAALVAAGLLSDTILAGQHEWLVNILSDFDATGTVMLAGAALTALLLLGNGLYQFYIADLPEVANRALFWVLNTALLVLAVFLTASGTEALAVIGMITLLISMISAAYAFLVYRVFDIRSGMILALKTLTFVSIAAVLTFAALYLAVSTGLVVEDVENLLVLAAFALIAAVAYVPLQHLIDYFVRELTHRQAVDPAQAAREYNQRVSEAVELNELISAAITTLNKVMRARRSCMILLNSTAKIKDAVEFLVKQPGGSKDNATGYVSVHSPIYHTLAAQRVPISQFEIDYHPKYRSVGGAEKQFFSSLQMNAYAPVIMENKLIGVLACGPMVRDTAFYPRDLELLATLAQQTGVALRNARLLDDLQHLNKSMQSLNRGLKAANEQLNKLDSVKTDFVTIASHELRTPLAQIRGYSDIIDAMNEQGMLDQDQTSALVGNLRKATERMEELISAMLDVSQLDVNAMDLRFTETPPETVLRMAIEPLTDVIKQRKLTLSARGLRGLPTIQADLPRLVQAFRNIVVNAIKFTPDGGRIEITASLKPPTPPEQTDHILIEIIDTGVGIDSKNLELIFRKFFRGYDPSLHSTGAYKFLGAGPGLGLTIARGVIEGHGGRIWAESKGHDMETYPGATFYVLLPVSTPDNVRRVLTFGSGDGAVEKEEGTSPKPPPGLSQSVRR